MELPSPDVISHLKRRPSSRLQPRKRPSPEKGSEKTVSTSNARPEDYNKKLRQLRQRYFLVVSAIRVVELLERSSNRRAEIDRLCRLLETRQRPIL